MGAYLPDAREELNPGVGGQVGVDVGELANGRQVGDGLGLLTRVQELGLTGQQLLDGLSMWNSQSGFRNGVKCNRHWVGYSEASICHDCNKMK